jgi:adenine/guanine phosphoribosyltransferase-like PRPP-binding protein
LKSGIASIDISACVKRIDSSFRAGQSLSFEEVRSSIEVIHSPKASPFDSLIVVDDILSSGRSVAAVVLALRESGFILNSTPVFVAAVISVESEARNELIGEEEDAKDRLADDGGA